MQVSEASALERAAAAESSNAQLTQQAENHQRALQELHDNSDATAACLLQALQVEANAKSLAEVRHCASCLWCTLWGMFCLIIRFTHSLGADTFAPSCCLDRSSLLTDVKSHLLLSTGTQHLSTCVVLYGPKFGPAQFLPRSEVAANLSSVSKGCSPLVDQL